MLAPEGQYYNYSGCGNTLNCNHPQVRHFILESLRYWVMELHIDGFRFDLASIMTRAPSLWHNHDKIEAIEEIHRDSQQQDAASPAATAGEENLPGAEVRPPSLGTIGNWCCLCNHLYISRRVLTNYHHQSKVARHASLPCKAARIWRDLL